MKEMIRFIGLDVHKDFMADGGAGGWRGRTKLTR
jgi:hypothetical protein